MSAAPTVGVGYGPSAGASHEVRDEATLVAPMALTTAPAMTKMGCQLRRIHVMAATTVTMMFRVITPSTVAAPVA